MPPTALFSSRGPQVLCSQQQQRQQQPRTVRTSSRRAAVRVKAVLATPQTEQQHANEVDSLRKAALITAVKTP